MIALSRRRPRSITLFAVLFFAAAVVSCIDGLSRIEFQLATYQRAVPEIGWSRDLLIVWHSAWLTIALIPIAMVWLSAVRFARWMVAIMALAKLAGLLMSLPMLAMVARLQPLWLVSLLLALTAIAMLFTSGSNRWFADKGGVDPAVFE
ncbi:cellulose synthase/poly-beta-1,6-N-acetylglucosamine synthase-like glycosyltransferase [Erythromicrobium ramosum]|jgi:hypothetical protein|uniref:Cellulose synthase/poly-beta-1,6-N-acetylglucosamine synthase-like glycosyltransferase n=1 Tax=Erythrobacter ramosus TaxID=35811 RepID=A0A6I4UF83_9SPHN|nr:hypothetical protein [Erythrobacter ramosus]MBB3774559.1 cellulose synthase/poly-beta-1,6-N-acetylglucosamine synthase-like glycosyltransferase [Erythrobacter ramosus]MXP37791.1 hypothetical protein [Erythrobacter ramosus]